MLFTCIDKEEKGIKKKGEKTDVNVCSRIALLSSRIIRIHFEENPLNKKNRLGMIYIIWNTLKC